MSLKEEGEYCYEIVEERESGQLARSENKKINFIVNGSYLMRGVS
jgi:hypothetical protein